MREQGRGRQRRRYAICIGLTVIALAGFVGCGGGPSSAPVARKYLAAWARGDYAAAARLTTSPPKPVVAMYRSVADVLEVGRTRLELRDVNQSGDKATATVGVALSLKGLGVWRYTSHMRLRKTRGKWRVVWSPTIVHPLRKPGTRLARIRRLPPRAPMLDRNGLPLFRPTAVVTVGVVPGKLKDRRAALQVLRQTTGSDPARVRGLLGSAPRDAFVPVITLRRPAFAKVQARLASQPGVRFQPGAADLAPTPTFGRALLGQVAPATAEALRSAGPLAAPEDQVGLSGLQLVYQRRLAGTPTGGIELETTAGRKLRGLYGVRGRRGRPVRTTLDIGMQRAAESALGGTRGPAALVAVQASSGAVRAVANRPADSTFDTALAARYPPGSTFKVVSTEALLARGFDPRSSARCPPRAVVAGKVFRNFEHETLGSVPFSTDFAQSCNAAFVLLSQRLGAGDIHDAASLLGFGTRWRLPVAAYTGQAPATKDPVERAAEMIGQDRVLASPLGMALVAAAVASGRWHAPMLVTDPAPSGSSSPSRRLPPNVAAELRRLMRGVVTRGTGRAANLPGAPIYGKTGTAEFGSGHPPRTHAWFIGVRGDLAIAVFVQGGGVGGRVAAPLAGRFFSAAR